MKRHQQRLARLETERSFYAIAIDPTALTDEQLDQWIAADHVKDPAGWQVLDSTSNADIDQLITGDPVAMQAYIARVEAIRRPGSP